MPAILDYVGSVLVGATVLLLVAMITESSLEAALGGNEHHVARATEMALAAHLTQDLRNVGAAGAPQPIVSGTDSTLVVQAPVRPGDSASTIRYERVRDAVYGEETVYRVERYVEDTLAIAFGNVTGWRVHCLDESGDTLSYGGGRYKTDTRTFALELSVEPGVGKETLGAGGATPRTWRTRIRPFHLND